MSVDSAASPLLRMEGVGKAFPGVRALSGVNFEVRAGEVHALVGENGSGKSTLMKIAGGEVQADEGQIFLEGEPVTFRSPAAAIGAGISSIAQEVPLVPELTVAENVLLGRLPRRRGRIDWAEARRRAAEVLGNLDLDLDPRTVAGRLPLDEQQMVSIARALALRSKLVIFDEATSSLTEDEVEALFRTIRRLRGRGVGVVFITHRLREIYEVADRVTVLRDGSVVGSLPIAEAGENILTRMMVGRELGDYFGKQDIERGRVMLAVRELSGDGVRDISFDLHAGEIVGLAGLVGAGRSELLRLLFGLRRKTAGEIRVEDRSVKIGEPRDAIELGMALVPEDRRRAGLVSILSVRQNLNMAAQARMTRRFLVRPAEERAAASRHVQQLRIKTSGLETPVRLLSGGNQQKVVLGKWMAVSPRIWLLDEPTRGVDVGAKAEIHRLMGELAKSGMAILMSSSELIDLLGVCDRILVMFRGTIVADLPRSEAEEERVIYYATGQGVA
jgi:ABC-type sugar transport system ATPase subunit